MTVGWRNDEILLRMLLEDQLQETRRRRFRLRRCGKCLSACCFGITNPLNFPTSLGVTLFSSNCSRAAPGGLVVAAALSVARASSCFHLLLYYILPLGLI
ncbi:hypothetical protein VNO78_12019 [Psophocarpus tetragonolobus]|uniref:Uncharacterized protein n=1 Tax=Psophocarpus tetragonolobus TaxID=3891 RepID=A0AAN9SMB3_PSOTE